MKKLFVVAALTITSAMDVTFKNTGRTISPAAQPMRLPMNRGERRALARMK